MEPVTPSSVGFGPFEFLVESGELCKNGQRLKLSGQTIEVLEALVSHPGRLVTREELHKKLWPDDNFGDFEHGLNAAINRLRETLGDSATEPIYIETVPRRGYRFIFPIGSDLASKTVPPDSIIRIIPRFNALRPKRRWFIISATTVLCFLAVMAWILPTVARFYNNRGVLSQRNRDLKQAVGDYRRALFFKPSYAEAHYNLGDAYEELSAFDKALDEYQRAIEAEPSFYEAYNNLARLYIMQRRDYAGALRTLDRGLELKPQEPSVQYSFYKNYGWANLELHNLSQAEANLNTAISLDANRGSAHCLLAKVLEAAGDQNSLPREWESCAAYSSQPDVEPEWRNEAQEHFRKQAVK